MFSKPYLARCFLLTVLLALGFIAAGKPLLLNSVLRSIEGVVPLEARACLVVDTSLPASAITLFSPFFSSDRDFKVSMKEVAPICWVCVRKVLPV